MSLVLKTFESAKKAFTFPYQPVFFQIIDCKILHKHIV